MIKVKCECKEETRFDPYPHSIFSIRHKIEAMKRLWNSLLENQKLQNHPVRPYQMGVDFAKEGAELEIRRHKLDLIVFDESPGSGNHEHEYDERGLCKCGDVWEEDDFSGATPGER